eukprot:TRINITY_DN27980_c0_g1_i1.p1 TRINITY_DN27980_c0_g1~~TRINITY_DN27980_c0_g1_i1.p1  ORF type:complete len:1302 (-),score=249.44 TRINITY_DN27980_c0_g1_i1:35-3655(-)
MEYVKQHWKDSPRKRPTSAADVAAERNVAVPLLPAAAAQSSQPLRHKACEPEQPATARERPVSSRSAYRTEQNLRWRLREMHEQLQATTAELTRTRSTLNTLLNHDHGHLKTLREGQGDMVSRQEWPGYQGDVMLRQATREWQSDLYDLALLAFDLDYVKTEGAVALRRRASELWKKWKLPGHPSLRSPGHRHQDDNDVEQDAVYIHKQMSGSPPRKRGGRVKRLWKIVSNFVKEFTGRGMKGVPPKQRLVSIKVKELCEFFRADFEGEDMGIHEVVAHHARRAEVDYNVQTLLQEPFETKAEAPSPNLAKTAGLNKSGMPGSESGVQTFEDMEKAMRARYNVAFQTAGGEEAASVYYSEVNEYIRKYDMRGRIRQDAGHEIMGIDSLYAINRVWMDKFAHEVQRLATRTNGQVSQPPLKGYDRARAKVLTKYGNDTACLTDLLRASIIYSCISDLYEALARILKEDITHPRGDFKVMEVNDRFQSAKDGYRDISLLIAVNGVICELQLHVQAILEAKKSGGHKAYRVQRQVNELIFEACVRNSESHISDLMRAYRVSGQGVRDKNGRGSLHYACQNGSLLATRCLISARADPWAQDDQGVLPFELALKGKKFDASELMLTLMVRQETSSTKPLMRISQQVLPWWCDQTSRGPHGRSEPQQWRESGKLMVEVLKQHGVQSSLQKQLVELTKNDSVRSVHALLSAGADQELSDHGQESILDLAIRLGLLEMVSMLISLGTDPTRVRRGSAITGPKCCRCVKESVHSHLRAAAKLQDRAYATAALAAKAHPDNEASREPGKRTPLMNFAAAGDVAFCRRLVSANAEVHWIDKSWCNALHYAKAQGRTEVIDFFKELRSDIPEAPLARLVTVQDTVSYLASAVQDGCSGAVHRALVILQGLNKEAVKAMQEERASVVTVEAREGSGPRVVKKDEFLTSQIGPFRLTFLHLAAQATLTTDPCGKACLALLDVKADPRIRSNEGDTPLHIIARAGKAEVYKQMTDVAMSFAEEAKSAARDGDENEKTAAEMMAVNLQHLLEETGKMLRRQLVTGDLQKDKPKVSSDDSAIYLQAGLLAFKHAFLGTKLAIKVEAESRTWKSVSDAVIKMQGEGPKSKAKRRLTRLSMVHRQSMLLVSEQLQGVVPSISESGSGVEDKDDGDAEAKLSAAAAANTSRRKVRQSTLRGDSSSGSPTRKNLSGRTKKPTVKPEK